MISWIQSTFQHHFKVVFAVLLFAMVIPLVFIYSTSGGIGTAEHEIRERRVFGKPYTTEQDKREFGLDGQISAQLSGQMLYAPEQFELYAFFRAARVALADRFGIPSPTPQQLEEYIRSLPVFQGENGAYDPQAYSRFLDNTRTSPIYSQVRVARILQEDWRADQVTDAIAGPGYALDPEIREQIAAADTTWTVHRATLSLKEIQPAGEPTEAELQQWFETNAAAYRNPPSVQASVVDFQAEKYLAQVQAPSEEDLATFFERNKARYAKKPEAGTDAQTPVVGTAETKLEDVRDSVIRDLVAQRALNAATKAASDFAYILFDKKITRGMPAFDTLVASLGTSVKSIPPLPVTPQAQNNPITREALSLSEDRPVSDPVVFGTAALVLFYDGRAEASDAQFSMVRERVLADVNEDRRRRAVAARGDEIRAQLTAALKSGTSITDAAKAAGLELKSWENFTRRKMPEDFDRSLMARITEMPVGEVSPMAALGEQGTFVIVAQRKEPVVTSDDPNYAEARAAIMRETGRISAQIALAPMVRAERIAADIDRPAEAAAP